MIRALTALFVWVLYLVVIALPVFMLALVYPSNKLFAWAARNWARLMLVISGVRLTVEGLENIRGARPCFFVGNHQSALDIPVVVVALGGDVRFMAKNTLFRIPIFGWLISRYGFVSVDRSNARRAYGELNRMIERLRTLPISFAAFPEGTRSRDGRLLPFHKGTLKLCQRSGLPIVPFSIDGTLAVHHRDEFLRAQPGPVRLVFAQPISAEEAAALSVSELVDRVLNVIAAQLGQPAANPAPESPLLALTPGDMG